jgi:dCTP deaminase
MILSWDAIVNEVRLWNINIVPFNKKQINPNSYNYRIWDSIKKYSYSDKKGKPVFLEEKISANWYILESNQMYLSSTYESIWSKKYMTSLIWKSSIWRLWLFLQLSANIWHTGTYHKRTLELYATKSIKIYPNMIIWQVTFRRNTGVINKYEWKYSLYNTPKESIN